MDFLFLQLSKLIMFLSVLISTKVLNTMFNFREIRGINLGNLYQY